MDLDLHYRDFVVDGREFIFNYTPGSVPSFRDRDGNTYCAVAAFRHQDPDLVRDPYQSPDAGRCGSSHVRHFGGGRTDDGPY